MSDTERLRDSDHAVILATLALARMINEEVRDGLVERVRVLA